MLAKGLARLFRFGLFSKKPKKSLQEEMEEAIQQADNLGFLVQNVLKENANK